MFRDENPVIVDEASMLREMLLLIVDVIFITLTRSFPANRDIEPVITVMELSGLLTVRSKLPVSTPVLLSVRLTLRVAAEDVEVIPVMVRLKTSC